MKWFVRHGLAVSRNFFGDEGADVVCDFNRSSTTNQAPASKEIKVKPVAP